MVSTFKSENVRNFWFPCILFNNSKLNQKRKLDSWNKWRLLLRNCNYTWFLIFFYLSQGDKFDKSRLTGFCAWRTCLHSINEVPPNPFFSCLVVCGIVTADFCLQWKSMLLRFIMQLMLRRDSPLSLNTKVNMKL